MRVTSKTDYAVRACVLLAASGGGLLKAEEIATAQQVPHKYLEGILSDLRAAGLVRSQRGAHGGYRLSRPASTISIADVMRAVEGPLATVRGQPAEELEYREPATALKHLWVAVRAALRHVLEQVTLEDIATGRLPAQIDALAADPASWESTAQRSVQRFKGR